MCSSRDCQIVYVNLRLMHRSRISMENLSSTTAPIATVCKLAAAILLLNHFCIVIYQVEYFQNQWYEQKFFIHVVYILNQARLVQNSWASGRLSNNFTTNRTSLKMQFWKLIKNLGESCQKLMCRNSIYKRRPFMHFCMQSNFNRPIHIGFN